ncbi:unnamed protein product [Cylindrotheca closterium]|uniref:Photosystem II 12 kDa extrinsic protein n=1 Tax=Cylindrotheca closterium TaxID=2856 RepID=A0AAD2G2V5_9STRA|nr:unnamed protein product [Cylindrotheca closterium]
MKQTLFVLLCVFLPSALSWLFPSLPLKASPDNGRISRRNLLTDVTVASATLALVTSQSASAASARLDVNNALAREFTAFPGLYPTIATKLVNAAKEEPFTSKKQMYAVLNEVEQERLKQYDKDILIAPVNKSLQQFKTSQICKYECGNRASSAYRDEQIKGIQSERR